MGQFNLLSHIRKLEIMKLKEYTNIQDYIEIKKSMNNNIFIQV